MIVLLGVPLALAILLGAGFVCWAIYKVFGGLIKGAVDNLAVRGRSVYMFISAGVLIGAVAALVMTNALSIIPPESVRARRLSGRLTKRQVASARRLFRPIRASCSRGSCCGAAP